MCVPGVLVLRGRPVLARTRGKGRARATARGNLVGVPRSRPSSSVLHGGWVLASRDTPAGFAIWGEQSPNVRTRPRTPRRRAAGSESRGPLGTRAGTPPPVVAPPHPFALSDDGVRHALSVLGLTRWATQTNVRRV